VNLLPSRRHSKRAGSSAAKANEASREAVTPLGPD